MSAVFERKCEILTQSAGKKPLICVQYRDARTNDDRVIVSMGVFERFDKSSGELILTNGLKIPSRDIVALDGDIFAQAAV